MAFCSFILEQYKQNDKLINRVTVVEKNILALKPRFSRDEDVNT